MKVLSKYGKQQLIKLLAEEAKLRKEAWLSFNPFKIMKFYKARLHRRNCADCRALFTNYLAERAGVRLLP